jgi:hypothetical protein
MRASGFACTAFDQATRLLIVASAPIAVEISRYKHVHTIYPDLTRRGAENKQGS